MLKQGILNPALNHLLARVRHTNTLVIADRGFPSWPGLETVDISLVDGIPTVADVLRALKAQAVFGRAWMAEEFLAVNGPDALASVKAVLGDTPLVLEGHVALKQRVPGAIGLIRTADTLHFSNLILESA
ncbi:MAG: RbsD/FucU domain-containing protein [Candidatus Methylacidiphilales bacterium]|nr:RbsD/FucU domain-containing protein [Candidatus Methylacidiphilales bacterium]